MLEILLVPTIRLTTIHRTTIRRKVINDNQPTRQSADTTIGRLV